MLIFDGEHCPICGRKAHQCGHAMTADDMVEEFAGGKPAAVIDRKLRLQTIDDLALVRSGPQRLGQIVGDTTLEEFADLPCDYWAADTGVVLAFFEGDRPGGSGIGYWHNDPAGFEARIRNEAATLLSWIDTHFPGPG